MSKADAIKNKITAQEEKKRDPRSDLIGLNNHTPEAPKVEEKKKETPAQKTNDEINFDEIAEGINSDDLKEPTKSLKGIYLDDDVLEVYEREASKRKRGWGSQLTSNLLRAYFEKEGLMSKRNK